MTQNTGNVRVQNSTGKYTGINVQKSFSYEIQLVSNEYTLSKDAYIIMLHIVALCMCF